MSESTIKKALAIHPMFHDAIENGEKQMTIRDGKREYFIGDNIVLYCGLTSWAVDAVVTGVTHANVMTVSAEHLDRYGVKGQRELLEALRIHYPTIQFQTNVTIIEFMSDLPDPEKKINAVLKWKACK